ncbi:MAG: hypothetical protein HYZ13_03050 [Acidobacteria bacterium]|nr:hypothetical protein [Acidobacteriota bacterium]
MRIDPKAHFQFLAKQIALVESLCRRETPLREGEVLDLIDFYGEGQPSIEELKIKGILEYRSQSDEYAIRYSLGEYVREMVNARRMIGTEWTQQQLQSLRYLLGYLEQMVGGRRGSRSDWTGFKQHLRDLERQAESIRSAFTGNLEVIREQVGEFRKQKPGTSRERFIWISRIWDEHLAPMADVFSPDGEWEKLIVGFEKVLNAVNETAPDEVQDQVRWVSMSLTEMVRAASHTHLEGTREVWPIYNSEKRDGSIARDASRLLEAARKRTQGWNNLHLDSYFGLEDSRGGGERFIRPFDDSKLAGDLAEKLTHTPAPLPVLEARPKIKVRFPLSDNEIHAKLRASGGRTDATLSWMVQTFPDASLNEVIRAYGRFVLEHGLKRVSGGRQTVKHPEGTLTAYPLVLELK